MSAFVPWQVTQVGPESPGAPVLPESAAVARPPELPIKRTARRSTPKRVYTILNFICGANIKGGNS
jgi:hypothetical protein